MRSRARRWRTTRRGLIVAHSLSPTQNPPQDSYQFDTQDRLISISRLGSKLEDLTYDAAGQLVQRAFTNGTDTARYYLGDDLTVVNRGTTTIGYVHAGMQRYGRRLER